MPKKNSSEFEYPELAFRKLVKAFVVPGDPAGYYAQAGRSLWKMSKDQKRRSAAYRSYKEKVRIFAMAAGLKVPLQATGEKPLCICTVAWFRNGVHPDPENVRKGIADALFKAGEGGGDKYTGGTFYPPMYAKNPRVIVEVWEVGVGTGP